MMFLRDIMSKLANCCETSPRSRVLDSSVASVSKVIPTGTEGEWSASAGDPNEVRVDRSRCRNTMLHKTYKMT